jgi:hypothetical protein
MKYPLVKQETRWFDKATLIDVIRFTTEQQLGEPPGIDQIESASDEKRFPVVWSIFHEKTPEVDWESFYRCGIYIDEEFYRVAVEPSVWDKLPIATLDVPMFH